VIVDEAAMARNLQAAWEQAMRPTLADLAGDAWFLSTPKGLNYFYQLYTRAQTDQAWQSWRMPSDRNPHVPADEIVAMRADSPERVEAQEIDAAFLADGTGVFRGVDAVSRLEPAPPQSGHQYAFGVDWAGAGSDFTVLSCIDITLAEQAFVERFPATIEYEDQPERLHEWFDLYRPRAIVAEANSMGGPLINKLQRGYRRVDGLMRQPLPVQAWTTTNASKAMAIQDLELAIQHGQLTLVDDAIQKAELLAFDSERLPSGLIRYSAPTGLHDDTVIALALAWQAAKTNPSVATTSYAFGGRR
jgi:hypothetical protein